MNVKKKNVIVAGHICLDIIPNMENLKRGLEDVFVPGKLVAIGPSVIATGGAVSNTGLALHRLGIETKFMGKVGDDVYGKIILDLLKQYDSFINKSMIVSPGEHSSYSIVIAPPGFDRVFLHYTGANDTFEEKDIEESQMEDVCLFHFGYPPLMKKMYEKNDGTQLKSIFLKSKKKGVTTSLDLAKPDPDSPAGKADWQTILSDVLPYVDIFLPSIEEIVYMLNRRLYDQLEKKYGSGQWLQAVDGELLSSISTKLLKMGCAIVVIKLGEHGLYVRTHHNVERIQRMGQCTPQDIEEWAGKEFLVPCFEVNVVGTTGAGDCTIAGFLAGLLHGEKIEKTILSAVAVGACNVQQADATSGIPTWNQVQTCIQGWKQKSVELNLPGWIWNESLRLFEGPYNLIVREK